MQQATNLHKTNLDETSLYEIAIIGMTGRFPGANTVEKFWANLVAGLESIQQFSDAELAAAGVSQQLIAQPDYVKAGAILEGIENFDAGFFGFTPKEASITNPQQRFFLECAWEVLERAGYDPAQFAGRIGVYAGAATNHYLPQPTQLADEISGLQVMVGNEPDYLATQVAYKLNLTGPALTLQTACSTSLVAVHQACQSLLNHECDMALAGGVTILLPRIEGYRYVEGSINAPDGHCRAFDAKAQGTVPGSGVGIVLLKRLADALAAGDSILAVVKGTAINNDGALKIGYTAPSLAGQANVIADAQAMANVDAETITYIETHGTGTALGDPIEIGALTQAFRATTEKIGFCKLGAVKTNIGHLGAASGVAGLIKTVLALQNQCIPPTLHFTQPNPKIDFANSPFTVNTAVTPWATNNHTPRRAGVSSFGIGGTNAHLILEEAPARAETVPARPWQLLMLSAQNGAALEQMTTNLRNHLHENPNCNLGDVAYTLQVGRKRFDHGRLLVCQSTNAAVAALAQPTLEPVITLARRHTTRPVVFMFSGQGSQHVEMGRELYQHEPLFRQTVDECAELLYAHLGLDLRTILYPTQADRAQATAALNQTALTQPALFVIEYALAQLWQSWGIVPQAMIGHSIGEYVAACLAGVFSLDDALRIVAARGRLMQEQPNGDMLATTLPPAAIQLHLNGKLSLAAINGPEQSVVAGPTESIAALEQKLTQQGIKAKRLATSHAFHSAMMEPMLEPFAAVVAPCTLHPPQLPYLSTLTGTWITAAEATDPVYWANHVRQPVNFAAGMATLTEQPEWILLEVGPGTTLYQLARQHPQRDAEQTVLASLPHADDRRSAQQVLLQTLGQLYLHGVNVDWAGFYGDEVRQRIRLPSYAFQRQRYWIDAPATPVVAPLDSVPAAAVSQKLPLAEWFAIPTWSQSQPPALLPQLAPTEPVKSWLLLLDAEGIGQQLAARLRQQGQTVITVEAGPAFGQLDPQHYALNPANREDYQALFGALQRTGQPPTGIVHLWQITNTLQESTIVERLDSLNRVYQRGFDSLLCLAQVLGERGDSSVQQIIAVSNQLHAVLGDEPIVPEKALLLGCCRVIAQEYPQLACRNVDIVLPPMGTRSQDRIIDQLLGELTCQSAEMVVAYRGRHRWVQHFTPVVLPGASATTVPAPPVLRQQGVYLITAGLSATGLRLAHELAQRVQAKLILLDNLAEARQAEIATKIETLTGLGAEVLRLPADVTDLRQMQTAIERATAHFGPIHGVIHIPAATNDGLIQLKTSAETRRVLSPSVMGTLVLEAVLQATSSDLGGLDFMVLFGSTVAISGGIGQVDECAASAFLDAYAHSRSGAAASQQQGIVSAIDWSLWQWDDRFEQSMAKFLQVQEQFRAQRETFGITQQEAGDVLVHVLGSRQAQLVVAPLGIESVLEQQRTLTLQNVVTQLATQKTTLPPSPGASQNFAAPIDTLEASIGEVWQNVFGMTQIGRHDNFFSLGGHSLLAIQLISRLRNALQLPELALSLLFEAPTVAALAETIRASQQAPDLTAELTLEELVLNEDADFAALIAEIEGLSEDELAAALA